MKLSSKAILAIVIVAILAGLLVFSQFNSSRSTSHAYSLSTKDMEMLVNDILPPQTQQQVAASPEKKQEFAQRLKELLAIAQEAERSGFDNKPEVKSQIDLQIDLALREMFERKNPGVKVEDDETTKYLADHPNEFNQLLDSNPQIKMQAQGPQLEGMKKEFAQIKILAARARANNLDQEDSFKIRQLLERSNVLANAYVSDLQQNSDKLVTDADIEQYYNEHKAEFDEVRVRHIVISTRPLGGEPDNPMAGAKTDDKKGAKDAAPAKPKALTQEEAKAKAIALRNRALAGEDFAKLASENSMEPGAKEKGGDLGYFTHGAMVPEFSDVAFAMKPGQISDVVETQFGYHVIKMEDRRTKQLSDEETKKAIADKVKQTKLKEKIKQIADSSNVQVAEDFTVTPKPVEQPPQLSLPTPDGAPPAPKQ